MYHFCQLLLPFLVSTSTAAKHASFTLLKSLHSYQRVQGHWCMQPLLMIGNISACVSILALGLAPNYTVAILSRFLGGLFTSGIGV